MDLVGALMLRLRGYRPYLILATCLDRKTLTKTQELRKMYENIFQPYLCVNRDTFKQQQLLFSITA